jgi:hypothetical protein
MLPCAAAHLSGAFTVKGTMHSLQLPSSVQKKMQFSHTFSSGQNLADFARTAHAFLCRNGNTTVDSRVLLSHLGSALAHLKPADPSFKWSIVFDAHPHLFQMLDRHLPGKAAIYAISGPQHRPQPAAEPAAAMASSSSALISRVRPMSASGGGALVLRKAADSAAHLTASVLKSLRAGPGQCVHEEVFVRHDQRTKGFDLKHAETGAQPFEKPSRPKAPKLPSTADIVFSFDTTGSMAPYIQKVPHVATCIKRVLQQSSSLTLFQVRDVVKTLVSELLGMVPNLRIGIMAHGDYCDKMRKGGYTLRRMYKLSNNPEEIHEFMSTCAPTGGGDADECYELVLQKAREMKWSKRASCKTLVLIGDANPHAPEYVWDGKAIGIDWRAECAGLKKQGIKVCMKCALRTATALHRRRNVAEARQVYGVHCGGSSSTRPFYQEVASTTGGQYLPLDSLQTMTDTFAALCLREVR